jgi:hypothetical protein
MGFKSRHTLQLICLVIGLFLLGCNKETAEIPGKLNVKKLQAISDVVDAGYNIENALPENYVRNGTVDYTAYLQEAIDKYDVITFPSFPILVNDQGLRIGSNKTINFLDGSELRLKPTSANNYHILRIRNASNIVINNPVIVGDREGHLRNNGEFGNGITIQSSSNITINNPSVTECWGIGIYLGHIDGEKVNENIKIKDAHLKKNRRYGIFIVAADGLVLENVYAGYTDGVMPMCGINIEPNSAENELKNIKIINPTTEFNGGSGIQIGTRNLLLSSKKEIDITISNHKDLSSGEYAMKVSCIKRAGAGTITGNINVNNPSWESTQSGSPLLLYMDQKDVVTTVSSPTVKTLSNTILEYDATVDALMAGVRMGALIVKNSSGEPVPDGPTGNVAGYKIENSLPNNFVRDGSQDYTRYVQEALDKYDEVAFPGFPIMINSNGLNVKSNRILNFSPGAKLVLKPTSLDSYNILKLYRVSNVVINNPNIVGDRDNHLGTTGEYGNGIGIYSSNNITINNGLIEKCWGDGIYLGHAKGSAINKNIAIKNTSLVKNRRDGIAIISADGLLLENLYAAYTDGTKPMCGINFEPNNGENELKNIKIINPRTEYNAGNGIQIGIRNLLLASTKSIDIEIIGHRDLASREYAMKVSCLRKNGNGSISGSIDIKNPTWEKTASGRPLLIYMDQKNVITNVSSPTVKDVNNDILNLNSVFSLLKRGVTIGVLNVN